MKIRWQSFGPDEVIPVSEHLNNQKLRKYFNRETAAAIVTLGKLLDGTKLPVNIPFYYATGLVEFEEYGLPRLVTSSLDDNGNFSDQLFVERAIMRISPLTSFKVLQNMTLAFVAIEHELSGDNAVVYVSASSLLHYVLTAPTKGKILIGAGKVFPSGRTESCFALITKKDAAEALNINTDVTAIALLRDWALEKI